MRIRRWHYTAVIFCLLLLAGMMNGCPRPSPLTPVTSILSTTPVTSLSSITPTPEPVPAKFVGTNLIITPASAQTGQIVNVTIDVKNTGEIAGRYRAVLKINGVEAKTNEGVLAAGQSSTTVFNIAEEKAGVYEIEIGGLTGKLTITAVPVPTYSNPQTYRVVRTITIKNETARADSLRVWLPAATEWDSQKNVVSRETRPVPSSVWTDPQTGTGIFFLEIKNNPPAGSSLVITDEFVFTSYEVNYDIDLKKITAYDKADAQYILYTRPENYLEANDANIVKTANALRGTKTNPYEIAQSFYTWVMGHMTYQNIIGLNGAKFAYDNGYGNCGDYSCLFAALCRASGIPARPIIGRLANSNADDWHVWAEFYLPGYGWVPVDATWGDSSGGNYFGHIDNKRLIFNKQCNIVLNPTPLFISAKYGILQTSAWEYQGVVGTISATMSYTIVPISGN
jgi:transglutaminase-like putative cysteine protease